MLAKKRMVKMLTKDKDSALGISPGASEPHDLGERDIRGVAAYFPGE